MDDFVNKQNCRICDNANPHEIHQVAMLPQTVTDWCGFWAGNVIGPYFFENDVGEAITINGEHYRTMLTDFFSLKLNDMEVDVMCFQQDGATCHTADATMDILHERFEGRITSRRGDVNWPPRWCDLTSLDFFLWGVLKAQVYAIKPPARSKPIKPT